MSTQSRARTEFSAALRIVDHVTAAIDRDEVLRYLGYPKSVTPAPRIADILDHWTDVAVRLAAPRAVYRLLPVAVRNQRSLRVETNTGVTEFAGAIGAFLGSSLSVAAFIATAGGEIERLASARLRQQDELGAMILNAIGAERAEAAEAAVIDRLREELRPAGLAPTLPYSPGYCGMQLVEQRKLFSLLDPQQIGVTLTSDCLMQPIKSVSGLIGLACAEDVDTLSSPCDRCEMHHCNMRR